MDIEITDEMVLRAARILRHNGWDSPSDDGEYVGPGADYMDLTVEPSPHLKNAARAALVAALKGIPANPYVTDGPQADE